AFDQANRLYEQGKFTEAASAYGNLVKAGQSSAALYFNLGNALLKSGELGPAILHYRLAQRLAPRDPDIKANLSFARAAAKSGITGPPRWLAWARALTLNELTGAAAIALWATFTLLTVRQVWPDKARAWSRLTVSCGTLTLFLALWLSGIWYQEVGSRPAVVVNKEAVVRLGPFEESQSAFVLHDGAEVKINDIKMDWLQIKDAAGRRGWVRHDQIASLNPIGKAQ
ncbi:MAG: tetratricopeptide repeat protein, partial [Verrucomicrobiales bacterium]|nr:tetratricopeptide repeat protein [Verrucomicrobiales bacterium]